MVNNFDITKIVEIEQLTDPGKANELLKSGWVLLQVFKSATEDYGIICETSYFVLGRTQDIPKSTSKNHYPEL